MKKYTAKELIAEGYKLDNALITNVSLSSGDYCCLTLDITIPEPIVFRNKQDTRGKLLPTDKVLVDDLDGWLSDIVSDYFGSAVTAATMNIDDNQNVINLMNKETKRK